MIPPVTALHSSRVARFETLTQEALRARLNEALALYVSAMRYPRGTVEQRAPMWLAHMLRDDWRCVAAFDQQDRLAGIAYGYKGTPGQWWHDQIVRGITEQGRSDLAETWLTDYFELTELHVRPTEQGRGIGERMLRILLTDTGMSRVLLSTPEGPSRAWRLYRRLGFTDVLRDYRFVGDPRPFGVLGRDLPLDPPTE
ncbi:ribosomal protein S18 acetylase RimI-like enzyme [Herbihabitans rhizosphaerae]|uniref:Ribosomal protein S18 acetylase RimI-like enzyme n=1 Tax=Herbihabitans rhizosphaerae TaxID=1872711 RepID=A0A4Q7KQY9_9PSEU|nr:GNAT family N-acetyltransferase [Herbihabitans rhizosphaerae]RZS38965.1 ribosomal protein S18 acetylase RimI-like enzyme [Herbihabitans rhizosphaerae]